MNYFVPPQGMPGIMQVPQVIPQVPVNAALGAHVLSAAPAQHQQMHMLAPAMRPATMVNAAYGSPRVIAAANPYSQTQLQQHMAAQSQYQSQQYAAAVAVSQYQAAVAAQQQVALQRVSTSVARPGNNTYSSTYRSTTPKPSPSYYVSKKSTVDAEVQTPETDDNPEADSSTKVKMMTSILACSSAIVNSEYRQLQSRLLTWGEKSDRQALEVTRIKADIPPSKKRIVPITIAAVIIFDDGQLQFCIMGKVLQQSKVAEREDGHLEDKELREYLNMLDESYSFCVGLSNQDLNMVPMSVVQSLDSLIRHIEPFPRASSLKCTKWCAISDGTTPENNKCEECSSELKKLQKQAKNTTNPLQIISNRKRLRSYLDKLPLEPLAKKRKSGILSAGMELGAIKEQLGNFQESSSREDPSVVANFLKGLTNDICHIYEAFDNGKEESSEDEEEIEDEDIKMEIDSGSKPEETKEENEVNENSTSISEDHVKNALPQTDVNTTIANATNNCIENNADLEAINGIEEKIDAELENELLEEKSEDQIVEGLEDKKVVSEENTAEQVVEKA